MLALLAFLGLASASIQILHPKDLKTALRNEGYIEASLGNFGHVLYGSSILARVYYPYANTDGCREFSREDLPREFFDQEELSSLVLMVDRGTCSFVTKVRNAEKVGVKVCIVADNRDEESERVVMTDDGSGHSISIPSFIIRKKEADAIKKVLLSQDTQNVYIKAQFEMSHPDNRVEYELWYSSILDVPSDTVAQLGINQRALKDQALFTPRILTYACPQCSSELKQDSCLADGAYCAIFPAAKLPGPLANLKGRQMLEESLRERCLYQSLVDNYSVNQNFTHWFLYAVRFLERCNEWDTFTGDCSYGVMKTLGIYTVPVEKCFTENLKRRKIAFFEEDREVSKQIGVVMHPAVTINNITFRGEIDGVNVFKAICAGFLEQPLICKGDSLFAFLAREGTGGLVNRHFNVARVVHIVVAVIMVVVINLLALFMYRKYQKRRVNEELQLQVNSAVSQYFRLSGTE